MGRGWECVGRVCVAGVRVCVWMWGRGVWVCVSFFTDDLKCEKKVTLDIFPVSDMA